MIDAFGWIVAVLGIWGAILNARMSIWGFYIWVVSNTAMILLGVVTKSYYNVALFSVYLVLSIYGIKKWNRTKKVVDGYES